MKEAALGVWKDVSVQYAIWVVATIVVILTKGE
jgi:hypothetical protein